MSEESLKTLSIDAICLIMIKAIDEYLLLEKFHEKKEQLEEKRAELKLIHKVIADKQAQNSSNK